MSDHDRKTPGAVADLPRDGVARFDAELAQQRGVLFRGGQVIGFCSFFEHNRRWGEESQGDCEKEEEGKSLGKWSLRSVSTFLKEKYNLTRQCLEILAQNNWPVIIQTRSPLVLRDIDIIKGAQDFEVGLSVTTADDSVRQLFEPHAPPIPDRIQALDILHKAGIRTYAMVAPVLPGAEELAELLKGKVDYVLIDRMNYHYADWVYRKYGLEDKLADAFFNRVRQQLASL
jgi:hypothetical protein